MRPGWIIAAGIVALTGAGTSAAAQPHRPRERFIICPGNPRCPPGPRIGATRGFRLGRPAIEAMPPPDAPPPATRGTLGADVPNLVYFGLDEDRIDARAGAILDAVAAWLATDTALAVSVEGHTDARGSRDYNLALGARRAAAVRDYLVARGIAADRLSTISYGEERPTLYDSGEPVWTMNRRVEIRAGR